MRLRIRLLVLMIALSAGIAHGGDTSEPWTGEWRTSLSILRLKQKGKKVTGTYGDRDQFTVEGKVMGDICSYTYTEGQTVGKGEWVMGEGGHAFKGKLIMSNGRQRDWHGWRPDPAAVKGKGSYRGMWLTDLGLMRLEQKGRKVKGTFGSRGGSSIEGQLEGRRLKVEYQVVRSGEGWFEMSRKGKTFQGAASDHGSHGWFEWKGRAAPEYVHHAKLKAGKIVGGATDGMLSYRVRAPDGYRPGDRKKWPCILILHGMNMNAEAYVNTLAGVWKDIAKEYIILGINGERPSYLGKPRPKTGAAPKGANPSFNYTYVNWMGKSTYKGYPYTDKESPALVNAAMKELKDVYPIDKYFVGGHSQGGYLTYVMLMHFPDQIAGAFPIAGGVIIQAEPDVFEDPELRKQQRDTPLIIIHSKSDPNVNWSSTQYAWERFSEEEWRAFRVSAPQDGGHMFGLLPVGSAIRWLEAMASDEPEKIRAFAERRLDEKAWADAASALQRAVAVDGGRGSKATRALLDRLDAAANEDAERFLKLIEANDDGSWIDDFLVFRDDFRHAPCARRVMAAFEKLRAKHKGPADEAYKSARQAFQRRDKDGAYAQYQEVLDEYYAAPRYRQIRRWVADRK